MAVMERDSNVAVTAIVVTADDKARLCLQKAFAASQWRLIFVKDGHEARALLAAEAVPVLIVDAEMGSPSWRELIEQAPGTKTGNGLRIIVLTHRASDRLWAEVYNLGGYDLLSKPLAADDVRWVVQSALSEGNGA